MFFLILILISLELISLESTSLGSSKDLMPSLKLSLEQDSLDSFKTLLPELSFDEPLDFFGNIVEARADNIGEFFLESIPKKIVKQKEAQPRINKIFLDVISSKMVKSNLTILRRGLFDLDTPDNEGQFLIHKLVLSKNISLIEELLKFKEIEQKEALINKEDANKNTPFVLTAINSDFVTAAFLLKLGAVPKVKEAFMLNQETKASLEYLEYLADLGFEPEDSDKPSTKALAEISKPVKNCNIQ